VDEGLQEHTDRLNDRHNDFNIFQYISMSILARPDSSSKLSKQFHLIHFNQQKKTIQPAKPHLTLEGQASAAQSHPNKKKGPLKPKKKRNNQYL